MKVIISVNSSFRKYVYDEKDKLPVCYNTATHIIPAFQSRGHDVAIVHPEDVMPEQDMPFKKLYEYRGNHITEVDPELYSKPDLFYVMELGENLKMQDSRRFITGLMDLEKKVNLMLNSARSTQYEIKDMQKTLDVPFIPGYHFSSEKDLLKAAQSVREGIIAKPIVGLQGYGVSYINAANASEFASSHNIPDYVYERYISADHELRVLFISGEILFARKKFVEGQPGKDEVQGYEFVPLDDYKRKIAESVMQMTGMFAGSVDFRDKYVQEINGSGIGLVVEKIEDGKEFPNEYLYNLTDYMVRKMEEKVIGKE